MTVTQKMVDAYHEGFGRSACQAGVPADDCIKAGLEAALAAMWEPIGSFVINDDDILAVTKDDVMLVVHWDSENSTFPWATLDGINYSREFFTHYAPLLPAPTDE